MTVARPSSEPPSPGARRFARPPQSKPAEIPFADLVAQEQGIAAPGFNAATDVDSTAVRFDGRPLVGPSQVSLGDTADPPVPPQADRGTGIALAGDARLELTSVSVQAAGSLAAGPDEAAAQLMAADATSPAPREHAPPFKAADVGGVRHVQSHLDAQLPDAPANGASQPPGRRPAARNPAPLATLSIVSGEVLVSVRGLELSASDREALLKSVRDLLARFHPAERSIRIVARSRKD